MGEGRNPLDSQESKGIDPLGEFNAIIDNAESQMADLVFVSQSGSIENDWLTRFGRLLHLLETRAYHMDFEKEAGRVKCERVRDELKNLKEESAGVRKSSELIVPPDVRGRLLEKLKEIRVSR